MKPIYSTEQNEIAAFFTPTTLEKAPEVGSRGLPNLSIDNLNDVLSKWTKSQEGSYK